MDFRKNPIIVADRDYFPLLFSFRREHPEIAFKLLGVEELIDRASISFPHNPIKYLLPLGMDYVKAKKYLRLLRLFPEAEELSFIRAVLPEEEIATDPLGDYELSRASIYLLEMEEDIEIHALLKRKGYEAIDMSLTELGLSRHLPEKPTVTLFQNKYAQYTYLFSSLRERLLQGEIKPGDVRIQIGNANDAFFLRLIGSLFGIKVDCPIGSDLTMNPRISSLLAAMQQKGALEMIEGEGDEYKIVADAIMEYGLSSLPFPIAYASLTEILQARKEVEKTDGEGILCVDRYVFAPESEIYLTCLQNGPFYKVYADDDVYDDATLLRMNANPSYVKTELERRKKRNFLLYHRFALLSRVKEHLADKIYASQFQVEGEWPEVPGPSYLEPTGVHTRASSLLFGMNVYDRNFVSTPQGVYRSYDSRYKGIEGYRMEKDHWSITNLKNYIPCPYKYYLDTVLPRTSRDMRPAYAGTMVHKVLEKIYDEDFDLEKAILEGKAAYAEHRQRDGEEEAPYDAILLEVIAENVRAYAPLIRKQREHMKLIASYAELDVRWAYADEKGSYPFKGKVDNVLLLGDESGRYFVVNDYKSGQETFHPYEAFLGHSIQLPAYADALIHGDFVKENGGVFAGMGIKTVLFPSFASAFKNDGGLSLAQARKSLASHGVFLNDEHFWKVADDTAFKEKKDKKGATITECKCSGDYLSCGPYTFDLGGAGHLSGIKGAAPYSLDELLEDTKKACLDIIHRIERGEFPMAPTSEDLSIAPKTNELTCSFCGYKDVCYRNPLRDMADYSTKVRLKFFKEEK